MSITRPQASSPEDIEKLVEAAVRRGASIQMMDPRMTSAQNWLLASIGMLGIAVGGWLIKSVNDQTIAITTLTMQIATLQRDHNELERDFRDHVNAVVGPPGRESR